MYAVEPNILRVMLKSLHLHTYYHCVCVDKVDTLTHTYIQTGQNVHDSQNKWRALSYGVSRHTTKIMSSTIGWHQMYMQWHTYTLCFQSYTHSECIHNKQRSQIDVQAYTQNVKSPVWSGVPRSDCA